MEMTAEQILSKLISFPILGGEGNLSIIHWIKDYIEDFGVNTRLVPNIEGTKASLHCRIGPEVNDGIILSGHTDVVPVKGQDWHADPFTLTDGKDGKLYGRGSCDMKGFLACSLANLPLMLKANLKRPIYFAFSYDEEIGCLGAPDLITDIIEHYDEKPKYAIIGEPTLLKPIVGQKGIQVLKTNLNGSAGHSSRIKQRVSAIHEAARLIMWLDEKMDRLIQSGQIDNRFTPPHSSLHVGQIHGGIAPNIIADKASFDWDLRTLPSDDLEGILNEYKNFCESREKELRKRFPDFKIKTTKSHPTVPGLSTTEDSDVVHLMREVLDSKELGTVAFASEAGQFANAGFESIICGPGSIEQAHTANEFITKEELDKGVKMIERLVTCSAQ